MINISEEILCHIGKLIGYNVTQEELLKDKLALHRLINLFNVWEVSEAEKAMIPELEIIDRGLHPTGLYMPVSPGWMGLPDYDEIKLYIGMTPNYQYFTMDFEGNKPVYEIHEQVYKTPGHIIEKHVKENLEDYVYNQPEKFKWLKGYK